MGLKDYHTDEHRRHPQLWFDDGNILVHLEDGRICQIHHTLLEKKFQKVRDSAISISGSPDWEPLLEHIYRIRWVSCIIGFWIIIRFRNIYDRSSFQTLSQLLTISREQSEHFPEIYSLAVAQIVKRYPSNPRPADYGSWVDVKEATKLCLRFGIKEVMLIDWQRYAWN